MCGSVVVVDLSPFFGSIRARSLTSQTKAAVKRLVIVTRSIDSLKLIGASTRVKQILAVKITIQIQIQI
jgi:hypothetical protein